MNKAIVLLSRGMDSAVTLFMAMKEYECHALIFNYGQKALKEVDMAARVSEKAKVPFTMLNISMPELNKASVRSIVRRFRAKKIHYLIASDVAGRGLDFSHVSHVINWDFPGGKEQYTHRTGRAGRMGRKGKAFTFVCKHDLPAFTELIRNKKISPVWVSKDPFLKEEHSQSHPAPSGQKNKTGSIATSVGTGIRTKYNG